MTKTKMMCIITLATYLLMVSSMSLTVSISLGQCLDEPGGIEWLKMVQPVVQERIDRCMQNEIRFSLLAVVKNRKEMYRAELKEYQIKRERILQEVVGLQDDIYAEKSSYEALDTSLSEVNIGIETISQKIVLEEEKTKNWKKENILRKHNYAPIPLQFPQGSCRQEEAKASH